MPKPCANCGCLKGSHGLDIQPTTTLLGNTWFRYLHPCLTAGCHCADYEYKPGLSGGYGRGDGIVGIKDVGEALKHLERLGV